MTLNLFPTPFAVWLQRINHFRCFTHNAPYMDSLSFIILIPWHSPNSWLSGGASSHGSAPVWHSAKLRYIVRLAALFRALGSSGDTNGSLLSR